MHLKLKCDVLLLTFAFKFKLRRYTMVAILGCFTQAITTGTGPVDNLFTHLADPGHNNIFSQ
jgi:hypothetical protein